MGINKVHVLGVSQGGQLATLLAIKYPTYVNKLVISNSYSEMPTIAASWYCQFQILYSVYFLTIQL